MDNVFFYPSDIGKIGIADNGNAITALLLPGDDPPEGICIQETALLQEAGRQLRQYFAGTLKDFTLPLDPSGSEFRRKVWQSLQEIPYGQTRSYKDIAITIGNPLACRAVGQANNRNPIPILIPCHRVIGANGKLVGYGGGLYIKEYLLKLEKRHL